MTVSVGNIGELTDRGEYWELVYFVCGHTLELARFGLEEPDRVVTHIQRHYAQCLTCRQLKSKPVSPEL